MEIEYFLNEGDVLELMQYRINQIPKRQHPMHMRRVIYLIGILLLAVGIAVILGNWLVSIPLVLFGFIFFFVYPRLFKLLLI
jgi:hypothetical protein